MSIALWCVFIAGMLPAATALIAKIGRTEQGAFDNSHPREWLAKVGGYRARAVAAMQNGFEGFPLYAAAVVIAQFGGAEQDLVNVLAVGYIATRLVFILCYLKNWSTLRSLVWFAGIAIIFALFWVTP